MFQIRLILCMLLGSFALHAAITDIDAPTTAVPVVITSGGTINGTHVDAGDTPASVQVIIYNDTEFEVVAGTGGAGTWSATEPGTLPVGYYNLYVTLDGYSETILNGLYIDDGSAPTWDTTSFNTPVSSPTSADTITFNLIFSEPVINFTEADLKLSGAASGTIGTPSSTDNTTWTVDITSVSGNGLIGLAKSGSWDVTDVGGTAFADTSEDSTASSDNQYTIDNGSPSWDSTARVTSTPTNNNAVQFIVVFSEALDQSTFTAADIEVEIMSGSLDTSAIAEPTTVDGQTWTVTVFNISGNATIALQASGSDISVSDVYGNLSSADGNQKQATTETSGTIVIDQVAPRWSSTALVNSSPSAATPLDFTVTFDGPVNNVTANDFQIVNDDDATGTISIQAGSDGDSVYTVRVSSVTGDGSMGIVANTTNWNIADDAGNEVPDTVAQSDAQYQVDNTAPSWVNTTRLTSSPTNDSTVFFQIEFSEAINPSSFTSADLQLNVSSGSLDTSTVNNPTTSDNQTWILSVSGLSGDATFGVEASGSYNAEDPAGNVSVSSNASGTDEEIEIGSSVPRWTATTLMDASPTNADSVRFQVTFSEDVDNVDVTDFDTGGDITGAPEITSVSALTGTRIFEVEVGNSNSIQDEDGELTLIAGVGWDIEDSSGNAVPDASATGTDDSYVIDNTDPEWISTERVSDQYINDDDLGNSSAGQIVFRITFDEPIDESTLTFNNHPNGDFYLSDSSSFGEIRNIVSDNGSETTFLVYVDDLLGENRTATLTIDDGGGTKYRVSDKVGNEKRDSESMVARSPDEGITLDNTGPTAPNVTSGSATTADTTPTWTWSSGDVGGGGENGNGTYRYLLDEDFAGSTPTETTGTSFTPASVLAAGDHTLYVQERDDAGNWSTSGSYTVTIDADVPSWTSTTRSSPTAEEVANGSVTFALVFSEDVKNVDTNDFELSGTASASCTITAVNETDGSLNGESATWDIVVSTGGASTAGTLIITRNASWNIQDLINRDLSDTAPTGTDESYTIDKDAPVLSSITRVDSNPTAASTVNFLVTFNENVLNFSSADLSITGDGSASFGSITSSDGGITWTVPVNASVSYNGSIGLAVGTFSVDDDAGNTLSSFSPSTNETYTRDVTGPDWTQTVNLSTTPTSDSTVSFKMVFDEEIDEGSIGLADIQIRALGAPASFNLNAPTRISATEYRVIVDGISGNGTLILEPHSSTYSIDDVLGNSSAGDVGRSPDNSIVINQSLPRWNTTQLVESSPNNGNNATNGDGTGINFNITFSESVLNVGTPDFALSTNGTAAGTIHSVSGTGASYTLNIRNITGEGDINIIASGLFDITNASFVAVPDTAAITTDNTVVIDAVAPDWTTTTRVTSSPTNLGTIQYTIAFDEAVTDVDVSDFDVSTTGTATGSVNAVSAAGGFTYTVTVNSVSGNGDITLVPSGTYSIDDALGNTANSDASRSTNHEIEIDNNSPAAPVITTTNPTTTADPLEPISGTGEIGATVEVFFNGGSRGTTVVPGSGNWTMTPVASIVDGSYTVHAVATDPAGNSSSSSASITVNIETATQVVLTSGGGTTIVAGGSSEIEVQVQDAGSAVVGNDNSTVIRFAPSGTAEFSGLSVGTISAGSLNNPGADFDVTVVNGVARLTVTNKTAEAFTVTITDVAATLSDPPVQNYTATPGSADKVVITTFASDISVGGSTNIIVQVQDEFGNQVTADSSTQVQMDVSGSALITHVGASDVADANTQIGTVSGGELSFTITDSAVETVFVDVTDPISSGLTFPGSNADNIAVTAAAGPAVVLIEGGDVNATITSTLDITVTDSDRNLNGAGTDFINVSIQGANGDDETLTLSETGLSTGIFSGSIATADAGGGQVDSNSTLEVLTTEVVTVTFNDPNDGDANGSNNDKTDTIIMIASTGTTNISTAVSPSGDLINEDLRLEVTDADLNKNSLLQETVSVIVSNTNTGESETVILAENGVNSSEFRGTLSSTFGSVAGTDDDGTIAGDFGHIIQISYNDLSPVQTLTDSLTFGNDDPTVSGTGGTLTVDEDAASNSVDVAFAVSDFASPDFNGGQLLIRWNGTGSAGDQLGITNGTTFDIVGNTIQTKAAVAFGTVDAVNNGVDGADLQIDFTASQATQASVQDILRNITYNNTDDNPATSRTAGVILTDGDGGTSTEIYRQIDVNAQNDAPRENSNSGVTVDPQDTIVVTQTDLEFIDPEQAAALVTYTATFVPATNQIWNTNTNTQIGFDAGQVATFTQADVNAGYIEYRHIGGSSVQDILLFGVADGVGGQILNQAFAFNVNFSSVPPTITIPGLDITYNEQQGVVFIASGATVTDTDSTDFDGGTLTVSIDNIRTSDVFTVQNVGNGVGQIGVNGNEVFYEGNRIATVSGGTGSPLEFILSYSVGIGADITSVQALIRAIQYESTTDNPTGTDGEILTQPPATDTRVFSLVMTDGDDLTGTASGLGQRNIDFQAVDDPPQVQSLSFALVEGLALRSQVEAVDPDSPATSLTYQTSGVPGKGDLVFDNATGVFTYTPFEGESGLDQFNVNVTDGISDSGFTTVSFTITSGSDDRPLVISDPPLEMDNGDLFRYEVLVSTPYVSSSPNLKFTLIGDIPSGMTFASSGTTEATVTGGSNSAQILWDTASLDISSLFNTYISIGVIVTDTDNQTASYQPIFLYVHPDQGGNG